MQKGATWSDLVSKLLKKFHVVNVQMKRYDKNKPKIVLDQKSQRRPTKCGYLIFKISFISQMSTNTRKSSLMQHPILSLKLKGERQKTPENVAK